jgi:hypothetical protein
VTASEFAFLALGLVLGVASGAALSMVIRARPPAPREVRVTVAPDAIPRRPAATLSGLGVPFAMEEAARGGPADPDTLGWARPTLTETRALVLAGGGPAGRAGTSVRSAPARPLVGIPIRPAPDALLGGLALASTAVARRARTERVGVGASAAVVRASADRDGPAAADRTPTDPEPTDRRVEPAGNVAPATGPCAEQRRHVEERCALADRLSEESTAASARLREAQRAYDDHVARADGAAAAADPRAILAEKEAAWQAFRRANADAHSHEAGEAAARDWLQEIDRTNRAAREAAVDALREREAANGLVTVIERLSLDADVARINAESAGEACATAREALAACEESTLDRRAGRVPVGTGGTGDEERTRAQLAGGPNLEPGELWLDPDATQRVFGDREPAILRLLRGDRDAMRRLVATLAGDDPDERRRWQLGLSGLVDAIVARAIEAAALQFPHDHPFWAPVTQAQGRDIATALASLGYRFDGLGGFADERVPSLRDLSLAVGYAGLDPMRIRRWPNESEMRELYRHVAVAADEFLAGAAGDLTLGEMVALLGGRAAELTDLWDAWGRIRPLLLLP